MAATDTSSSVSPASALQGTTGSGGRKLPTARIADLEARVHQAVEPIPYIHRDQEDTIRARLRARRPVLLIGSSMVGKTKMAARVVAEEFGSWPVVIPDGKTALADLDARDVTLQNSVIWLDDIDRLIGAGGITDGALRRLATGGNIIVGTIRARAYDLFQPSDQLRRPEWDVLSVFEHVFISRELTQKEQARLADAVDDPDIRDRIRRVGLGEYVGAARQVAEALQLGATGTEPLGYALVLAAADWRRCGMARPVPSSVLVSLARPHLDQPGQARLADQEAFKAGLAWATRDINPNVALLQPAAADSYGVYDYALDLISAQNTPIPDRSWAEIMANADPPELVDLGYAAEVTYHRSETGIEAWRKAADSGHADAAPMAAYNLGLLLQNQGDVQGAKDAYQKAIDSGDADVAPIGAIGLGDVLTGQGDVQGAKDAYQKAIDSGHADWAPRAAVYLGWLLRDQGDVQGAKDAFQKAIDSGHADAAPRAVVYFGEVLEDEGDVQGAKDAFQKAIDSGDADAAPRAAVYLGWLLRDQGDVQGAKNALQKAIDFGDAVAAPRAALGLGLMLEDEGDVQGAKDAFQKAIDSGHADWAPEAARHLGVMLEDEGDVQDAKDAFQKAIDSGHADWAPLAAVSLGEVLNGQGDVQGAKEAWQRAIDSGHVEAAPPAAYHVGEVLQDEGDVEGAKDAFQKAIDSGHADWAPKAAVYLGEALKGQGDVQGAKEAWQKAIDSGHADWAPLAAVSLGEVLQNEGDVEGAKDAYQKAIDSGDADAAPLAAAGLGLMLQDVGDVEGAKDAFQKVIDSGHADWAPKAAGSLRLLQDQGDVEARKRRVEIGGSVVDQSVQRFTSGEAGRAVLGANIALQIAAALDSETSSEQLLDEIERFDRKRPGKAFWKAALRHQVIPGELARAFIVLYLRTWQDRGRETLLNLPWLPELSGDPELCRRLSIAFECARVIAGSGDADAWVKVPALLEDLATGQDVDGRPLGAAYLRLFAAQVTTEPTDVIQFAERCAIAASTGGDLRLLCMASCLRAIGFQRAWVAGTAEEIQVFDAMDSAMRHLTTIHPPDAELLDALALEVQEVPVKRLLARAMLPLFRASGSAIGRILPPASDDEPPIELNRVIWDSDPEARAKIARIFEVGVELELDRGGLEQEPPDPIAHAEWSSWSFQHSGYRRAVPHGRSLERERDADDIFLVIHHEVTHVAAMAGGIGAAIMALRAAALELEGDLWSEYELIDSATFAIKGVTPLGPPTLGTLYWAAYQLDILAKMQTLQDVWNPWFEGLAVFAELCDNPTADDTSTTAADILVQLIDTRDEAGQTVTERRQALRDMRNRFEQRVVQTQRRLGPAKLQFYCEAMSAKYMGGFLAVRSVIAAWRRSVGELSGHAAIRLLLHITRFGTYSLAVPDLSLDPDEFAVAAQNAMVAWVRRIAELPADDIRFVVGNSTANFGWSGQRVDKGKLGEGTELAAAAEEEEEVTEIYTELVRRALHSASSVGRDSTLYVADHLFDSWTRLLTVLPLGRTTARFWIDHAINNLLYVVRTMEHRQDNGQPSYDLAGVPLTPEEMAALEAAVAAHPFDRLTIARFAELYRDVRGFNAIAFRLGDWTYVQAHGWAFGSDAEISRDFEEAVKLRLDPNPALRMESNLIAATTGAAARTADWAKAYWPTSDKPDLPDKFQEILNRLVVHAAEIRDHDGTAQERAVSERLVTEIIGDPQQAADLVEHGLAALTPYDPDLRTSAYEALLVSGDEPAYAEVDLPDGHVLHNLIAHGKTGWDVIPFPSSAG